ncbi:MAG: 2,3-diaminopropionate for siderophore biosynthesis protein SbnB, partial [uncultured Actinomycetospora sp.]
VRRRSGAELDHRLSDGAAVRGDPRRTGGGGAARTRARRRRPHGADLPAPRRRPDPQPAVVLPHVRGPPHVADHRAARVGRRRRERRRDQVGLELPGERGGGGAPRVGRADPQRPRHGLPLRLPRGVDHQRQPHLGVGGAGRGHAHARPGAAPSRRLLRGGAHRPLPAQVPGGDRVDVRRDRRVRPEDRERRGLPRLPRDAGGHGDDHRPRRRRVTDPGQRPGRLRHGRGDAARARPGLVRPPPAGAARVAARPVARGGAGVDQHRRRRRPLPARQHLGAPGGAGDRQPRPRRRDVGRRPGGADHAADRPDRGVLALRSRDPRPRAGQGRLRPRHEDRGPARGRRLLPRAEAVRL